ncbi:MAG: hypothetical protein AAFY78_07660 [Cyanobacteria bacterium J06648_16]
MLTTPLSGAQASTAQSAEPLTQVSFRLPEPASNQETVRHMLFGSPDAVRLSIRDLHRRQYAEPNDWSRLLPTGRPNEVMAILTRRVKLSATQ